MNEPPETIAGPRLDLVVLETGHLRALQAGTLWPTSYQDPAGFLGSMAQLVTWRLNQIDTDPAVRGWLLRAVVARATNQVVGRVNFHDRPDAAGMVEIGYAIAPGHRRLGYGREVALTLWDWAATQPEVRTLRASISPDNLASMSIVGSAGLRQVGEQIDPEDGLELIFEISADEYRDRRSAAGGSH